MKKAKFCGLNISIGISVLIPYFSTTDLRLSYSHFWGHWQVYGSRTVPCDSESSEFVATPQMEGLENGPIGSMQWPRGFVVYINFDILELQNCCELTRDKRMASLSRQYTNNPKYK